MEEPLGNLVINTASSNATSQRRRAADDVVVLEGVRVWFGGRRVFDSLSCAFPRAGISVILGGSGAGKSTILRLIGGLVRPQAGTVHVDGQDVPNLPERKLYRVRRKLGMLFQGGALLDSYSVFDNVALPLREQKFGNEAEIAAEVHATLKAVGVDDADTLLPNQLSGGMLRRVALARAIIRKPTILLCDEPFSGLDPLSTRRIESLLVDINRRFHITLIIVSHHVPSALRMADRVLLILGERVIQGSPEEVRQDPDAAEFLDEGPGDAMQGRTH
jgi:phospholipid/cholesterol/gamma-HCH transport system ATP-binding protein